MNRTRKKHSIIYIGVGVLFLFLAAVMCQSCGQELAVSEYEENVNRIEAIDVSDRQAELNAIVEKGKMNVNEKEPDRYDPVLRLFYSPTALLVSMVWTIFSMEGLPMPVSFSPRRSTRFCPAPDAIQVGSTAALLGSPFLTKLQR